MKFGEQLAEHIATSSSFGAKVWVDYTRLKQRIRQRCDLFRAQSLLETASFKRSLRKSICCVNAFFVKMEAHLLGRGADYTACPHLIAQALDLKQYAILNYIAILKLLKKHDKHCATQLYAVIERILVGQPFVQALLASPLFYGGNRAPEQAPGEAECEPSLVTCAICMEPRTHLQPLACRHEFCTLCLAKASAAELHACPVCRSPQPLHPIDISLGQLNISLKFSPRAYSQPPHAAPAGARGKACAPSASPRRAELGCAQLCTVHERASDVDDERSATGVPPAEPGAPSAAQTAAAETRAQRRPRAALRAVRSVCRCAAAAALASCARLGSPDVVRLGFSLAALSLAGWLFAGSPEGSGRHLDGAGVDGEACAFGAHSAGVHIAMLGYDGKTSVSAFSPGL